MKLLESLINTTVEQAEKLHDYVQLHFDNKSILNINNRFAVSEKDQSISKFKGLKVKEVTEMPEIITISFSNGQHINIGLKDEDFTSPEALELTLANGSIFIWP
ncbi:hypothetical protein A7981_08845 [Methylovorus sp. MM2]|uniref:hypothetical protein n=1 Tax=Methylovorus sp. MM2 TaxID=1848038 RepID=UPI0007DEBE04|nr:hypothetical protein [Methylovorus sp. MM2]OAM51576.1 hypothetical protein A7981_08845 [Methylovorus sp. MM2]